MNRPNLAELVRESALKVEEERDFQAQVARVTAIANKQLARVHAAEHKSEGSRQVDCPLCGGTFDVSWRTDDVGLDTGNDDPDNGQDDDDDYDNRTVTRLNKLAKSLAAEANK